MNEAEYYQAIERLPKTAAGLEEKLKLLEQVVWDEPKAEIKNGDEENVQYKKRTTRVENYYYGVSEQYLSLWIALRKEGIVLGKGWLYGHIGNRVSVHTLTLSEPLACQPMPADYDGRLGDGLW